MKIRYLGTAAAEGIPGLFCGCEVCENARRTGGKEIRTRSQALIDGRLLIDFPADTYAHVLRDALELFRINTCLITHNHSDHLYPPDLEMRRKGFAYFEGGPLVLYATQPAFEQVMQTLHHHRLDEEERVLCRRIEPFVPFEAEGYRVTPLKADHDPRCEPVFYLIEKDGKAMLYGNDTGYFPEETWEYLAKAKPYLHMVSLDCTCVLQDCRHGHMGLEACAEVRGRLMSMGLIDVRTVCCVHHFSHNGGATHAVLEEAAAAHGFLASYDGMELSF